MRLIRCSILVAIFSFSFVAADSDDDCMDTLPDGTQCNATGQFFYPDVKHCSRYWQCFDGCATHMLCELDYLYSIEHEWCTKPQEVTCGERDCDERDCYDNHEVDYDCPQPNGYFEDEDNCIKYYHCYNDKPKQHVCDKKNGIQLLYNSAKVLCDWPNRVNCGNRPVCDENDENCEKVTTPKPDRCHKLGPCSIEGDLKELGPCENSFCECAGGKYVEMFCRGDLIFNKKGNICDWPYNVDGCQMKI